MTRTTKTALLALVAWIVSGPIFAAPRVLLAAGDAPLSAAIDPAVVQTLANLKAKTASAGSSRVIVGVRVPFAPEGALNAGQTQQQRSEIAAVQAVVLGAVPSLWSKPAGTLKVFESIPFFASEVDSQELAALTAHPDVISIVEDEINSPSLAESVPIVGADIPQLIGYTGAGQTVAILDSGVDKTHPFLTGKVISEACYSTTYAPHSATTVCPGGSNSTAPGSGVNCSLAVYGCKHGTHVAGISSGNGVSFDGVAPGATVIAVQVFSRVDNASLCGSNPSPCALSYSSDQILGLDRVYALRSYYSIAAANMSLGGGQYYSNCDAVQASRKAAIDNLRSVGIATVISSGNESYTDSIGAPACISTAVSVGATTKSDAVASYSNSASFLSLLAPGSAINSSVPGGSYEAWNGTSMAAPHVTGAWALMKQLTPGASVTTVLSNLQDYGTSITDSRNGITKKRIQLQKFFSSDDTFPYGSTVSSNWRQPVGSTSPWVIHSSLSFLGSYSLISGIVSHNQRSEVSYRARFESGTVSFARRVSSEANYDFLFFYIDGALKGSWSGSVPWARVSYPITAGIHTLLWRYVKNSIVSGGSDRAWIDTVILPPHELVGSSPWLFLLLD